MEQGSLMHDTSRPAGETPFWAVLEGLPAAAYICDVDGRITYFNEHAVALWGRRPKLNDRADRYCGSHALMSADGAPLPHDMCWMALALRHDTRYEDREIDVVRPDGSRRTALAYANPLHDGCGRLIGAANVLVDVTERERTRRELRHRERELNELLHNENSAKAALQASEANFRGFFDSVAIGACQVDNNGRFIRVNDRYCRITGYSREELMSMGPFDLDHPEDREADAECVARFVESRDAVYRTEKRYVRKDGSTVWVRVAANLLRDESGRPLHTAAVVEDISERKHHERALREADRLKDEFLATLAHELRNPLAPIMSAVELLRYPNEQRSGWCRGVIERQVNHLTRLVDDLLDISRIMSDKLELRRQRLGLTDVLDAAIEASRPVLERCGQELVVATPREPLFLDGDLIRLAQVFTNLLTNAAKFTDGAGTIRLTAAREDDAIRVGVRDTGIGIAQDELEHVFEKFYQAPGGESRTFGGLGIGLSLVRRVVALHGGTVEASSEGPGRGSEFVVRLPVAASRAECAAPAAPGVTEAGGKRILIVDDSRDGADSLSRLLQLMGHDTATAYDGLAALERAAAFAADVVLLDLGMPGADGFEVCRRLREQSGYEKVRIVALTGWGRREDIDRTGEGGFDAHLVKPVDRAALERLLEN